MSSVTRHSQWIFPGRAQYELLHGEIHWFIELLFVFVGAVFVAPRSEELGIAT